MSLGKRVAKARLTAGLTQGQISEDTGIAVSYLSRVENDRVVPGLRTLRKLARTLNIPLAQFLDIEASLEPGDRCPVSLSGRCILDQPYEHRGRKRPNNGESYSAEQLKALRLCNLLLQRGDRTILTTLITVLSALASQTRK